MKLMSFVQVSLLAAQLAIGAVDTASIDARVVATLTPPGSPAWWAQFSPEDPMLALVATGSGAFLIQPYSGKVTKIERPGDPAGWLFGGILWCSARGTYTILDPDTMTPDTAARTLARVSLPRTLTRGEDLTFVLRPSPEDLVDIQATSPGGRIESKIFAYLVPPRYSVSGEDSRAIVDQERAVRGAFPWKIYGMKVSPDGHKLVVSFGERHVVWNGLTGATVELPTGYSEWMWFPDSATVVGSEGEMPSSGQEVIIRTKLAIFETTSSSLKPLRLSKPYDDAVLEVLAVSSRGLLLLRAHRTLPRTEELGWVFVAPVWR